MAVTVRTASCSVMAVMLGKINAHFIKWFLLRDELSFWYHTMFVKPLSVLVCLFNPFPSCILWHTFSVRSEVKGENVTVTFFEIIQKTSWNIVIFYTMVQWLEQYSHIVKVPVTAQLFLCAVCMHSMCLSEYSLGTLVMPQSLTELPLSVL